MHVDEELDALDFICPLLLLHTKKKINVMQVGKILKVTTKDRSSVIDFKTYTSVSGHTLLKYEERDGVFSFYIKK